VAALPADLDPGIRNLVIALHGAGFNTTDSGDGASKDSGDDVLPYPHVFIVSAPDRMLDDARAVHRWLIDHGATAKVEASYDPDDSSAIVAVYPGWGAA
jgi:poly(3-hydroxybutyrate) depolymerase